MVLRQRLDVCALSETQLNGKGEVMFDEVVGRVSLMEGRRTSEGRGGTVTECLVDEVFSGIEEGVSQAYVS